ncbi:MAG: hypothetical protein EBS73_07235 [Betaproteobacteria bacterium]|nr:hypothetical protein [Betaproteobacteria bacterium]
MNRLRRRFNEGAFAAALLGKLSATAKAGLTGLTLLYQTSPLHALGTPEVSVKEVQLQGIDREQVRLLVILKMDNSNPIPIPLSTIQFLARIEDRELAKAIPGALDRGLVALFGEGLRYDIEGTAELGGMFRIPFRKMGKFTRAQLLAALRA